MGQADDRYYGASQAEWPRSSAIRVMLDGEHYRPVPLESPKSRQYADLGRLNS
jgi:hypothetical protein